MTQFSVNTSSFVFDLGMALLGSFTIFDPLVLLEIPLTYKLGLLIYRTYTLMPVLQAIVRPLAGKNSNSAS